MLNSTIAAARVGFAIGVALGLMASSRGALAFCRTTTCDPNDPKQTCPLDSHGCNTTGHPLYWPVPCSSYDLQQAATPGISFAEFSQVAQQAFASWVAADCGDGQSPSIDPIELEPIAQAHECYNQVNPNVNAFFFQSVKWPYPSMPNALALTTVKFNTTTGEIYDVDMEINSADHHITVGDAAVENDLQAIMTHEIGHYFGLAHSDDLNATMYAKYKAGSIALRQLRADDVAGICAIYPPGNTVACDPTPRHGFGTACGDPAPNTQNGCCSSTTAPGHANAGGGAAIGLLASLMLLMRARRGKKG